jgi:ATP-dependent Clp protease protease subunit
MYYDKIVGAMTPTNMTPYIIEEERQLNISQLDFFSR